jgi:hypothetical protein
LDRLARVARDADDDRFLPSLAEPDACLHDADGSRRAKDHDARLRYLWRKPSSTKTCPPEKVVSEQSSSTNVKLPVLTITVTGPAWVCQLGPSPGSSRILCMTASVGSPISRAIPGVSSDLVVLVHECAAGRDLALLGTQGVPLSGGVAQRATAIRGPSAAA